MKITEELERMCWKMKVTMNPISHFIIIKSQSLFQGQKFLHNRQWIMMLKFKASILENNHSNNNLLSKKIHLSKELSIKIFNRQLFKWRQSLINAHILTPARLKTKILISMEDLSINKNFNLASLFQSLSIPFEDLKKRNFQTWKSNQLLNLAQSSSQKRTSSTRTKENWLIFQSRKSNILKEQERNS